MNLYALINRFGQENDYKPFTTSATALYFYLLYKANSRRWQMPIRCPTTALSQALNTSRQTVITARDELQKRGFIDFIPGQGKTEAPFYTIIDLTDDLTVDLTDKLTDNLTDGKTDSLTIYNIKDKNIKDEDNFIDKNAREKKLSLDELERTLTSDDAWHNQLFSLLSKDYPINQTEILTQLSQFFEYLRCNGFEKREEQDCKSHFFNWLNKKLKSNDTRQQPDMRRSSAVTAKSAADYEGSF